MGAGVQPFIISYNQFGRHYCAAIVSLVSAYLQLTALQTHLMFPLGHCARFRNKQKKTTLSEPIMFLKA